MNERSTLIVFEALSSGSLALLKAGKRMELWTVVVTHPEVYEAYDEEMKGLIDEPFYTDLRDEDAAVAAVVTFARGANVVGVVSGFEFTAALTVRVASALGLPTHDPDRCQCLRRKDQMNGAFVAAGVPCPLTYVVNEWGDCVDKARRLGFPNILKAAAQAGSYGVFGIPSEDRLAAPFNCLKADTLEFPHGIRLCPNILLQEMVGGEEVSVEVAVFDGEARIVAITDKLTTTGDYFAETGHTVPTRRHPRQQRVIAWVARNAVAALGMRNGVAHVEAKLCGDYFKDDAGGAEDFGYPTPPGRRFDDLLDLLLAHDSGTGDTGAIDSLRLWLRDQIKVIEVGARLPGDKIVDLLLLARGIDLAGAYVQIALGQAANLRESWSNFAAIRFLNSPRAGVVKRYDGVEAARSLPGVVDVELYVDVNGDVKPPTDNLSRVGHVIARGASYAGACAVAEEARKLIQITLE